MKTISRADITDLEDIPNVGPAIAASLRLIGVSSPKDLLGKDPYKMYDDLGHVTGVRHDPCVIDVFIAAVRFMTGELVKPWWKYTQERKRTLAAKRLTSMGAPRYDCNEPRDSEGHREKRRCPFAVLVPLAEDTAG
mgnify:CR=1 FL=1